MKELANFDLETIKHPGWEYKNGNLQKNFNKHKVLISENSYNYDYSVLVVHYSKSNLNSAQEILKVHVDLFKQGVLYMETKTNSDDLENKILIERFAIPTIIYDCSFKEKLDTLENYVNLLQ